MKLIFEISPDIYDGVEKLVRAGRFRGLGHFLDIACRNQLAAEEGEIAWPASVREQEKVEHEKDAIAGGVLDQAAELLARPAGKISTIPEPPPSSIVNSSTPLWGQYYRFLPMKVGARVLANMANHGPVALSEFHSSAAEIAARFRLHLLVIDRRGQKKVGEKLATSFPTEDEKSLRRYISQFLVEARPTDGRYTGFMARLFFASTTTKDGKPHAGLTPSGAKFAGLVNPVIDGDPSGMLSDEESAFLLSHLVKFVQPECNHMAAILRILASGPRTGEDLTDGLRGFYKAYQKNEAEWSLAMMNTMRAGATSRMSELGLIRREIARRGAPFAISKKGEEWLGGLVSKRSKE